MAGTCHRGSPGSLDWRDPDGGTPIGQLVRTAFWEIAASRPAECSLIPLISLATFQEVFCGEHSILDRETVPWITIEAFGSGVRAPLSHEDDRRFGRAIDCIEEFAQLFVAVGGDTLRLHLELSLKNHRTILGFP
jgi:hypothetical protein